jgi:hypothetical protein
MFDLKEKEAIKKYYELSLEELDKESFAKKRKQLRAKYHPDNFEKYEDETVREMATERFQKIEEISDKMASYFAGDTPAEAADAPKGDYRHSSAVFAAKKMKIEIIANDKDLKYRLFGRRYRWLLFGDEFPIPDTGATIVMDEDHKGNSIGFQETIRMYLTFGEEQKPQEIVDWLYPRISEGAKKLLVEGETVDVHPAAILQMIQKRSFLRLGA